MEAVDEGFGHYVMKLVDECFLTCSTRLIAVYDGAVTRYHQ